MIPEKGMRLRGSLVLAVTESSACDECVTLCHAPPSRDQSGSSAIVILAISPGASQIIKLITAITL